MAIYGVAYKPRDPYRCSNHKECEHTQWGIFFAPSAGATNVGCYHPQKDSGSDYCGANLLEQHTRSIYKIKQTERRKTLVLASTDDTVVVFGDNVDFAIRLRYNVSQRCKWPRPKWFMSASISGSR